MIRLTPAAIAACHDFIKLHGGTPINNEQLEAMVDDSLDSLFVLIDDQPWLTCADTHQFNAIEARAGDDVHYLVLHTNRQPNEDWLVGTKEEYPITEEYLRRRAHSEAEIVRRLMQ